MKVQALKTFRDKYTRALYRKGAIFDVTEGRAAEMNSAPAAPLVEEAQPKKKGRSKKEG